MRIDILDCTLRDGGYYTLWDFDNALVTQYLEGVKRLPIKTVEIGYVNSPKQGYYGEYFYLDPKKTRWAKSMLAPHQRLGVMLDEKAISPDEIHTLLSDHVGSVDVVRIAVAPTRLRHAAELTRRLKELDFEVGVNIMYLSKYWNSIADLDGVLEVGGIADALSLVDSYGSCTPSQVSQAVQSLKHHLANTVVGFHGHDNLGLAVANSLAAIEAGAEIVDGTMTGMGRGPGNTRTETMIVQQAHEAGDDADYTALAAAVGAFGSLHAEYKWGTNLVYMISGAAGLPQNNVMDWIGKNRYSVPAIISALRGERSEAARPDDVLQLEEGEADTVMIIGGGSSVAAHAPAIAEFAKRSNCLVIFATVKQLALMQAVPAGHYFALAGDAPAQSEVSAARERVGIYLVPATPRIDVELADAERPKLREVEPFGASAAESHLGPVSDIAPLALALGAARRVGAKNVILAGFDGYAHASTAQQELSQETQNLIACFSEQYPEVSLRSATRTLYRVPVVSIYAELLAHRIEKQG